MLADCFRGHGTFIFKAAATLAKFGDNPDTLVQALRQAGMSHAWVRLHDYKMMPEPETPTRVLVDALRLGGIALAGWGFDTGHAPEQQARETADQVKHYGLTHYVADIEQDEHGSTWTPRKIPIFLQTLRDHLPAGAQLAVSSYPYLKNKHPDLMRAAVPYADAFAPQIYWQNYPSRSMLTAGNLPPHPSHPYNPDRDQQRPDIYADLCLDWWREAVGDKPLVLTGQAYWETIDEATAERKLTEFLRDFTGWSRLVGVNWWHLGHRYNPANNGAMSAAMFQNIVDARVDEKPFAALTV